MAKHKAVLAVLTFLVTLATISILIAQNDCTAQFAKPSSPDGVAYSRNLALWTDGQIAQLNLQIEEIGGVSGTTVWMAFLQQPSSKWIQVSISDLENGYTGIKIPIFDFGPWSFCSYSLVTCNNSNNCEITKCRAVKEADLSDFFHSFGPYRASKAFAIVTMILAIAAIVITLVCQRTSKETHFAHLPYCSWIATAVSAAIGYFCFVFFGVGLSDSTFDEEFEILTNFGDAFILCWFSVLGAIANAILTYFLFKDKIKLTVTVAYSCMDEDDSTHDTQDPANAAVDTVTTQIDAEHPSIDGNGEECYHRLEDDTAAAC